MPFTGWAARDMSHRKREKRPEERMGELAGVRHRREAAAGCRISLKRKEMMPLFDNCSGSDG